MKKSECINIGKEVFDIEIKALEKMKESLDDVFYEIVNAISECDGKTIITGIGKPGHIAKKMAATFASLGTPAFYLNPAEAMHGDLGMVSANDIVIAISYSGESDEIVRIIPNIRLIGAKLIGITGNATSTLAKYADLVQIFPAFSEACHMGLAPTSSTTVELCYGDAIAIAASDIYGFKKKDFGKFHPAGSLGKKLVLKVSDIMTTGIDNAVIKEDAFLTDAIVELSQKGLGIVSVINHNHELLGVITDGDLRRQLEKRKNVYSQMVRDVMSKEPFTIEENKLAVNALNMMKKFNISSIPVIKDNKAIGTIRLQDIIKAGIVI